jgi:hypothetical protein
MVTPSGHAIQHSPVAPLRPQPCRAPRYRSRRYGTEDQFDVYPDGSIAGGGIATKAEVKE